MDQDLMLFQGKLLCLQMQKDDIESDYIIYNDDDDTRRVIPQKPKKDSISELWLENNVFEDFYKELLSRHYQQMYYQDAKLRADFEEKFAAYSSIMYGIGPKGKPDMIGIDRRCYCAVAEDAITPAIAELEGLTQQILAAKKALFKNKKKLNALVEQHKALRDSLRASYDAMPRAIMERRLLDTFAFRNELDRWGKPHLVREVLFDLPMDLCIPAFFFHDSLYAEKGKEYKSHCIAARVELVPKAAVAIITKDLQAADGDAFFKKGVTVEKVLAEVKKRAEQERAFAERFDMAFVEEMVKERVAHADRKTSEPLLIRIPYMGLNYLRDEQLVSVAEQIFRYFSLFAQYGKYETWFKNYPMANYLKALNPPAKKKQVHRMTMAEWEVEAAKVLPAGRRDIPYFDYYYRAVREERFSTYYALCQYVKEIRERDQYRRNVQRIADTQKTIVRQNNAILQNQVKLYEQNEEHHKERLAQERAAYQGIMGKLDDVQKSVDRAYYSIYY